MKLKFKVLRLHSGESRSEMDLISLENYGSYIPSTSTKLVSLSENKFDEFHFGQVVELEIKNFEKKGE